MYDLLLARAIHVVALVHWIRRFAEFALREKDRAFAIMTHLHEVALIVSAVAVVAPAAVRKQWRRTTGRPLRDSNFDSKGTLQVRFVLVWRSINDRDQVRTPDQERPSWHR